MASNLKPGVRGEDRYGANIVRGGRPPATNVQGDTVHDVLHVADVFSCYNDGESSGISFDVSPSKQTV